jgi:HAD superfamily hydrolase (TIGR01509 family)
MPVLIRDLASKYKLFVFDWDGTLLYLRFPLALNEAIKRAFRLWNVSAPNNLVNPRDYNLRKTLAHEEIKNRALTFLTDVIFMLSKPKLHNDTIKILKMLKKKHKLIALFSNGGRYRLIKELSYLGIKDYFKVIVSARDFHTTKPDPTGLKAMLYTMKVDPREAIYLGDMVDDIIAAGLVRMHTCGVADGFDSYHTLKSAKPEYLFRSMEELSKAL